MASSVLTNGLLGMGGFGGLTSQVPNSLLGNFYDPKAARNYQMKQMLLGLGLGLMSEPGFGRGAELAITMGGKAGDDYRQNALMNYKLQTEAEDRAYTRERDKKNDAWTNTQRDRQLSDWDYEDQQRNDAAALRQGKQKAVGAFVDQFKSQGGDLFDPSMQGWLRGQGISGVDPADTLRYGTMKPYVGAGDYENAFSQMVAEPPKAEQFTLGEGQIRYDEYGNPIAVGPSAGAKAPQVETFFDPQTGQQYKAQWDAQKQDWVPIGGRKADDNGITITNPDGTVTQIGGKGNKKTEADSRAELLAQQIVGQEPQLMAGFDALATPNNFAGSQIPGGAAIMSPNAQIAKDALTNTVANWLYLTSGATATDAEIERQTAMVTPSPFDSPERVAAKKARLKSIIDTMKARAGMQATPANPDEGWTVLPNGVRVRQKGQ